MKKLLFAIIFAIGICGNALIGMNKDWHTRQQEQQKKQAQYEQQQRNFVASAAVLSAQINNTRVNVSPNVSSTIKDAADRQNIHAMLKK